MLVVVTGGEKLWNLVVVPHGALASFTVEVRWTRVRPKSVSPADAPL
jgi:hypothetical protein